MTNRFENWPRLSRILDKIENANNPREYFDEPEEAAIGLFIGGVVIALFGYVYVNSSAWGWLSAVKDFYANFAAEAISIGITVLIIERLTKRRAIQERKEELILQMGSPDNAFAVEAARQLRARGWLEDGSLSNSDLWRADLSGAFLLYANLSGANINLANLSKARPVDANLSGAYLIYTDLSGADLSRADLSSADLRGANLTQANLTDAVLTSTRLGGADLRNARIIGADLSNLDLSEPVGNVATIYNYSTKWPEDFDPVSAGAVLVEDDAP